MSNLPAISALVVLAVLSVILDIVGVVLSPELRPDFTLLLFGSRLVLDVAIVAGLFLRRRAVWIILTALYALAILWRALILVPGLLGITQLPSPVWAAWLLATHFAIAVGSVVLLSLRQTRGCFGYETSA
jgi:hypothetical protein